MAPIMPLGAWPHHCAACSALMRLSCLLGRVRVHRIGHGAWTLLALQLPAYPANSIEQAVQPYESHGYLSFVLFFLNIYCFAYQLPRCIWSRQVFIKKSMKKIR